MFGCGRFTRVLIGEENDPHHPEAHCDSACGLYSTTLLLIPLDAHFARLKIGYAHRDKAKYPPYYTERVQ